MSTERSRVTDATKQAEAEEALAPHVADRPAGPEVETAAEDREVDDGVGTHYREMTDIGAREAGEGRIP
jgi:hypothetical protein